MGAARHLKNYVKYSIQDLWGTNLTLFGELIAYLPERVADDNVVCVQPTTSQLEVASSSFGGE